MQHIKKVDLSSELKTNFLAYAEEVIKNRAIPDNRDGLKPVHRRILWSMWEMGCKANNTMKKSARVVGDCMKYHPHGDLALYNALVRMAQPFSITIPLIKGQGNFGSLDDSGSFASMRYTECKLSEFSEAVLFADIDDEAVDMVDNYTGEFKEPTVLPARIPLVLMTGVDGIAVGMATSILPHNLAEICAGMIAYVNNPALTLRELGKHIKGPDFPSGGRVRFTDTSFNAYNDGNGVFEYRAGAEIADRELIFKHIPYGCNKSDLIRKIAELVRDDKLQGVMDVRDESVKADIRVCVDLKRGVNPQEVMDSIFRLTNFGCNFSTNSITIVNNKPKLIGMLDIIKSFIEFRREVIHRRTATQKRKSERRREIVEAILTVNDNVSDYLDIIRFADDPIADMQKFKPVNNGRLQLNKAQAEYIYTMPMRRISKVDVKELVDERDALDKLISDQNDILKNPKRIDEIIITETTEISKRFGYERRTKLCKEW